MSFRMFSFVAISAAGFLMSACSPINSEFSCKATAGDSCLTIEQVDAMTGYANGAWIQHPYAVSQQRRDPNFYPSVNNSSDHALVWVTHQNEKHLKAEQNLTLRSKA
jgi:conjugal transfer pilus assembly protein TraV